MKQLNLKYNNQMYDIEFKPFYDGVSIAILLVPQNDNKEDVQVVSVASEVPAMIDSWVLINHVDYPDIESVLIENNIIESSLITQICYGDYFYPCYSLTDEAYDIYQNELEKLEFA